MKTGPLTPVAVMPSIMIVDDNPDNLRMLCAILTEESWKVRPVSSSKLAMQAAVTTPPDVILLDIMMPDLDGFEVCRRLKQKPATRHVPIIMVTSLNDRASRIEALQSGADDFLTKPVDSLELVARTRNLLRVKLYGDLLKEYNERLEHQVAERTSELQKAYDALQATQLQLVQQEKMASMGVLMAGIAHEINNPIGYISSNLQSLMKYGQRLAEFIAVQDRVLQDMNCSPDVLEDLTQQRELFKINRIVRDFSDLIQESLDGAGRVRKIVQDMKLFSRADDDVPVRADLNQCLESTLNLVKNELKYKATVTSRFGDLPCVLCCPHQLNQVFMNLLVNAAHAIVDQGEVAVQSKLEGDRVCITISDTGCGIPAELRERIFEPFFTTKEAGKGTGLGLSISYDIVRKHGGEIRVDSEVGKGTTFRVLIPVGADQVES